jgi:hypothetical protein
MDLDVAIDLECARFASVKRRHSFESSLRVGVSGSNIKSGMARHRSKNIAFAWRV